MSIEIAPKCAFPQCRMFADPRAPFCFACWANVKHAQKMRMIMAANNTRKGVRSRTYKRELASAITQLGGTA